MYKALFSLVSPVSHKEVAHHGRECVVHHHFYFAEPRDEQRSHQIIKLKRQVNLEENLKGDVGRMSRAGGRADGNVCRLALHSDCRWSPPSAIFGVNRYMGLFLHVCTRVPSR